MSECKPCEERERRQSLSYTKQVAINEGNEKARNLGKRTYIIGLFKNFTGKEYYIARMVEEGEDNLTDVEYLSIVQ